MFALCFTACGHEHNFGEWETFSEATCVSEGVLTRKCECGAIDNLRTEKGEHDLTYADCNSPKQCTHCGYTEGAVLGHNIVSATCTVGSYCSRCATSFSDPEGHKVGNATCVDLVCEKCNETVKEQDHAIVLLSEKAVTLLADGYKKVACTKCDHTETTVYTAPDPKTFGIPILYMTDYLQDSIPLSSLLKSDGEISVKYSYYSTSDAIESFEGYCKIKIQGATSSEFPKKNFTVKLYSDEALKNKKKVDLGFGSQNKYCLKANYIDFSQARNVVGAKLFTQLVKSRSAENSFLAAAPNYGVIDGYPILMYLNGEFYGIYTLNIPKDQWMTGMDGGEEDRQAMLMADAWTESVQLYEEIGEDYVASGWEVEFCSTEDQSWIRESFNKIIRLLNCGDNERIRRELPEHLDIEAAIDNVLYTFFINAADNTSKNILWLTYDGVVWIPTMYDMDGTFGIFWNGQPLGTTHPAAALPIYPYLTEDGEIQTTSCRLYQVMVDCFADEVEARWAYLRQEILTVENTEKIFSEFFALIPEIAYTSDAARWTEVPYPDVNRGNIYSETEAQLQRLDAFFYNFNK